jgi:hypothetical protein
MLQSVNCGNSLSKLLVWSILNSSDKNYFNIASVGLSSVFQIAGRDNKVLDKTSQLNNKCILSWMWPGVLLLHHPQQLKHCKDNPLLQSFKSKASPKMVKNCTKSEPLLKDVNVNSNKVLNDQMKRPNFDQVENFPRIN